MACVGCGPVCDVPPAHVGKLSTASGLQEGIIPPSKIRLDAAFGKYQNLILVETADKPIKESMTVFMPKDQLNLTVEVRGIATVSADLKNVDKIFARISPKVVSDRVSRTDMDDVYLTYGQNPVREVTRTIVTKYSIDQLMLNRESISQELLKEIRDTTASSPISFIDFGLADIQPPKVVIDAQETAKEREIGIKRAESQKQINLQEAQGALEVAIKRQEVDLKEAETQVLVDKKLSEGVSEAFVMQRALRIWENISTNQTKTIILPSEAIKNPSLMFGVFNKSFSSTNN